MTLIQTIERVLFGRTAEEVVTAQRAHIEAHIDRRLEQIFDQLAHDEDAPEAQREDEASG
jgi:hypothetical protein